MDINFESLILETNRLSELSRKKVYLTSTQCGQLRNLKETKHGLETQQQQLQHRVIQIEAKIRESQQIYNELNQRQNDAAFSDNLVMNKQSLNCIEFSELSQKLASKIKKNEELNEEWKRNIQRIQKSKLQIEAQRKYLDEMVKEQRKFCKIMDTFNGKKKKMNELKQIQIETMIQCQQNQMENEDSLQHRKHRVLSLNQEIEKYKKLTDHKHQILHSKKKEIIKLVIAKSKYQFLVTKQNQNHDEDKRLPLHSGLIQEKKTIHN